MLFNVNGDDDDRNDDDRNDDNKRHDDHGNDDDGNNGNGHDGLLRLLGRLFGVGRGRLAKR
jgi:hypothetical protein